MNMKLSVGIPAFNQGNYLRKTLDSLLMQEQQPYEIVVSDNHSTDETPDILEEYKDKIRIVRPPNHLGMMAHWNFLVSQLNGEWFTLLSSDDIAKPNYVSTLLEGISRSNNSVLVRAGWENIDENCEVTSTHYLLSVKRIVSPPNTLYENLLGPKTSFAAFAAKHGAWKEVGGFPENFKLIGDWGFWLKLSPLGDFIYEHQIISGYRTNYRPTISKVRLSAWVEDEIEIRMITIPDLVKSFRCVDHKKVFRALRNRFLSNLATISQLIEPEDRDKMAIMLYPWACLANCQADLMKFEAGKIIKIRTNPLRKYLRNLLQYVRAL